MEPNSTSQCIQAHNTKVYFHRASYYLARGFHKKNRSWILILICPVIWPSIAVLLEPSEEGLLEKEIDSPGEV